jgi:hypothetical protein
MNLRIDEGINIEVAIPQTYQTYERRARGTVKRGEKGLRGKKSKRGIT